MDSPNFYAILPANVRYAKDLSEFQKLLYAEITALSDKHGYCRANNKYFANLYEKAPTWISTSIKDLNKKGYIDIEQNKEEGNLRKIYIGELKKLKKTVTVPLQEKLKTSSRKVKDPYLRKLEDPLQENQKHNNTSIILQENNKSTNVDKNVSNETLSELKDISEKKYGNEEINEIMEIIKKYNDGITNGSDGRQRQFAKNLIIKLKKIKSVENGAYTRQSILDIILNIIKDDTYYSTKIGSPELIFYNLASFMQVCRQKMKTNTRQF